MFSAAVIVFREVLEAALLIGIIAAATRGLAGRGRWLTIGVAGGVLGAMLVAGATGAIASMADGSGQEVFNAVILGLAVLMLAWHNIWMAQHGAEMARAAKQIGAQVRDGQKELSAVALVVGLAVLREGSETVLFLQGLVSSAGGSQILLGGLLGLVAGALLGVVIYFGLLKIPLRWFFSVTGGLLLLLAAGLASQPARVVSQGNWLSPLVSRLWDSSAVLPTDSRLGSVLHVLIGYDAQPDGLQVVFYVATLLLISLGAAWAKRSAARPVLHSV